MSNLLVCLQRHIFQGIQIKANGRFEDVMGDGINLICIPHAGGSAVVYMKWKKFLNNNVRLHPIELSGRGSRYLEPFYITIEDAALEGWSQAERCSHCALHA